MTYKAFLDNLDKQLEKYFKLHKEHINCCLGCSSCCENGDRKPVDAVIGFGECGGKAVFNPKLLKI
jgi:hypothetical protein